jgi:hypothetical protein
MQEILMNTHKFWREIQQTKWHFWEERRVLPFVQLPVILRIFEENQNPVDMHTSITCINIIYNTKAVAAKHFVRPSGYRYMVCPAVSSYSFGATALIFCRMFIHI